LKQADIGVAMGSGSEVTKAARMILTDDNFGTLVHAVELGRRVYDKIVSYVRFQMTQLLAGDAVHRGDSVQHQRGRGADAADGAVPLVLRYIVRRGGHRRRSRRPGRDEPAARDPKPITHRDAIVAWVLYAASCSGGAVPLYSGQTTSARAHRASDDVTFVVRASAPSSTR
jgi:Ca2+-transporting ATPase